MQTRYVHEVNAPLTVEFSLTFLQFNKNTYWKKNIFWYKICIQIWKYFYKKFLFKYENKINHKKMNEGKCDFISWVQLW